MSYKTSSSILIRIIKIKAGFQIGFKYVSVDRFDTVDTFSGVVDKVFDDVESAVFCAFRIWYSQYKDLNVGLFFSVCNTSPAMEKEICQAVNAAMPIENIVRCDWNVEVIK